MFEDIGLWDNTSVSVTGTGEPERIQALLVTDGTLPVLRVQPALGRIFSSADDKPGAPGRVLLTHGYWQRKRAPTPVCSDDRWSSTARRARSSVCCPPASSSSTAPLRSCCRSRFDRAKVFVGNFSYQGLARLKSGTTLAQANADVARMLPLVVERFPLPNGFTRQMFDEVRLGPNVRPLSVDVIGDIGRTLWVLLGTVGDRPADRVRERRQPVSRARRRAAAGARDTRRARREPQPYQLGASVRKSGARRCRAASLAWSWRRPASGC